ncbi:MAG: type II 3-dehydroquinate dehydratase [Clostridia bacterium]|nr:type II 3-dehydroquinate dehydratase [Clostridia bacterium]
MKILVVNGPNLNMLGIREPKLYGRETYEDLCRLIREKAEELGVEVSLFQSNSEGEIVTRIQQAYGQEDGIIINPGAYTHTSIAILDALKAVGLPAAEVHLTDINAREPFRRISYAGMACDRHYIGLGMEGYLRALEDMAPDGRKSQETANQP